MAQAGEVARLLEEMHRGLEVSLVEVTTSGDRDRRTSVTTLTEVGAFVRAVQETVLDGRADLAVHSCKDLPVDGPAELIPFYPNRGAPWDVLCGHDLSSLPSGALVGSGSPRRSAQLRALRPDVQVRDIRGNVDTRLDKVQAGEYDAVVLAEAGLRRLGRVHEIGHRFSLEEMVPAPGQAALAVEARADTAAADLLAAIDDEDTRRAVEAERSLLAETRAGCRSALGALAEVEESVVRMTAFVADEGGPRIGQVEAAEPEEAARRLRVELGL